MSEKLSFDPDDLLQRLRANQSEVNAIEIGEIVALLESPASAIDRHTFVSILGYGGMNEARPVVERLLTCSSDPLLAAEALEVLCSDWSLTADYAEAVADFARGVTWDEDGDVQHVALRIMGEELSERRDRGWFRLLLHIARDEAQPFMAREAAIRALATGLGDDVLKLPSAAVDQPLDSEWSINTLRRAEQSTAQLPPPAFH